MSTTETFMRAVKAYGEACSALSRSAGDPMDARKHEQATWCAVRDMFDNECKRAHELLILQHAESVELWGALKDLSFECDGVTQVIAPSRETYNKTFALLQRKSHLSPEARSGYASSGVGHVRR